MCEKTKIVSIPYDEELAEQFKEACEVLNVSQWAVLKEAMETTIQKANNLKGHE